MRFLNLIWVNIKKLLKNRSTLLILVLVPIGTLAFTWFVNSSAEPEGAFRRPRLIHHSETGAPGKYLQRVIDQAGLEDVEPEDGMAEAMEELRHYRLLSVIETPPDFERLLSAGQKPVIKLYKVDQGNVTIAQEQAIEAEINAILREVKLAPYTSDPALLEADLVESVMAAPDDTATMEELMPVLMMMFFMSLIMGPISEFMTRLRKNQVLLRLMATANSGRAILGSMFWAFVIVQMFFFSLGFFVLVVLYDFTTMYLPLALLYLLTMGVMNIALSLLVTRWVRNEVLVTTVASLFPALFFFLYMMGALPIASEAVRNLFGRLNLFNPFYWAIEGIENARLLPNLPVLILMILVIFTAGSLRLRNYAMEP